MKSALPELELPSLAKTFLGTIHDATADGHCAPSVGLLMRVATNEGHEIDACALAFVILLTHGYVEIIGGDAICSDTGRAVAARLRKAREKELQ